MGPTKVAAELAFVFAIAYLLGGYWVYSTGEYQFDWTIPYCVMCLRLIGFAQDYVDGAQKIKSEAKDLKTSLEQSEIIQVPLPALPATGKLRLSWDNVALNRLPSLVETLSYCFFFAGAQIGPQFPFVVYERFIGRQAFPKQETTDKHGRVLSKVVFPSGSRRYALRCFLLGCFYLAMSEVGHMYFWSEFVITDAFAVWPFWKKLAYTAASGRFALTKYLGVWILNEGGCALAGMSFNGFDLDGKTPLWNGLSNIVPWRFETATSFGDIIGSFNINTNLWCKYYIFKRLRFLGNKLLSSLFTLLFLAVWHGFAPGYFLTFGTEFMDVETEDLIRKITRPFMDGFEFRRQLNPNYHSLSNKLLRGLCNIIAWCLVAVTLGHGVVTFTLLSYDKVAKYWHAVYYFPHVVFVVALLLSKIVPRQKKSDVKTE